MIKYTLLIFIILFLQISCSSNISTDPSLETNLTLDGKSITTNKKSFTEFNDIPIPDNSTMNVDKTLLLGEKDRWIGRLLLNSPLKPEEVFDFYKLNLSEYNWEEITSVRSTISILTYSLNDRIMTVQIAPIKYSAKNSSSIDIVMSPKITK